MDILLLISPWLVLICTAILLFLYEHGVIYINRVLLGFFIGVFVGSVIFSSLSFIILLAYLFP